jgi:transcriptional regulator with XRE-family HTH domain
MANDEIDLDLVIKVLAEATSSGGFSQRSLSRAATNDADRSAVYDIIQGRNRNPSIRLLAALAREMGRDISIFGLSRNINVSEEKLREALARSLPHMPKRANVAEQAEFLAEAVAGILELPKTDEEASRTGPAVRDRLEAGEAPSSPRA